MGLWYPGYFFVVSCISHFYDPCLSRFRQMLQAISVNKWFDYFILLLIFYSCVLLALENPNMKPDSTVYSFYTISSYFISKTNYIFVCRYVVSPLTFSFFYQHYANYTNDFLSFNFFSFKLVYGDEFMWQRFFFWGGCVLLDFYWIGVFYWIGLSATPFR